MKKMLAALLSLSMIICVSGCEKSQPSENATQTEPSVTESSDNAVSEDSDENSSDSSSSDSSSSGTTGAALLDAFKAEAESSDLKGIADKIAAAGSKDYELVKEDCSEGFLPGFSADIKGFSAGIKLAPMIGSVPFVAYVFETDDAAALMETLKTNADPRWNICTEAKETVSEISGNYVFFAMCPGEE